VDVSLREKDLRATERESKGADKAILAILKIVLA
jgi:hypothetical protein